MADKYSNVLGNISESNSKTKTDKSIKRTVIDAVRRRRVESSGKVAKYSYKRATFLFDIELEERLNKLNQNMKERVIDDKDFLLSKGFKTNFINEAIEQLLDKYEKEYGVIEEIIRYVRLDNIEVILSEGKGYYSLKVEDLYKNETIEYVKDTDKGVILSKYNSKVEEELSKGKKEYEKPSTKILYGRKNKKG